MGMEANATTRTANLSEDGARDAALATLNSATALAADLRSRATLARLNGDTTTAQWADTQASSWEALANEAAERLTELATSSR
jgi:hypothetical protein